MEKKVKDITAMFNGGFEVNAVWRQALDSIQCEVYLTLYGEYDLPEAQTIKPIDTTQIDWDEDEESYDKAGAECDRLRRSWEDILKPENKISEDILRSLFLSDGRRTLIDLLQEEEDVEEAGGLQSMSKGRHW